MASVSWTNPGNSGNWSSTPNWTGLLGGNYPGQVVADAATLGASTHCMAVMVDDVDLHYEKALAAGATAVYAPRDMAYGVREYAARDLEGGLWSFMTPLNTEGDAS